MHANPARPKIQFAVDECRNPELRVATYLLCQALVRGDVNGVGSAA